MTMTVSARPRRHLLVRVAIVTAWAAAVSTGVLAESVNWLRVIG